MTAHSKALARPFAPGVLYLEIEGIPYAYGTTEADASWFDKPGESFEGIKPWLRVGDDASHLPVISGQRVDFINSRVSIGALRIGIVDMDGSLAAMTAPWRTDGYLRLSSVRLTTDAATPSTKSLIVLATVEGTVRPGYRLSFADSGGARTVTSTTNVATGVMLVTVSTEFAKEPGLSEAVTVDTLAGHEDADAFDAQQDNHTGASAASWVDATIAYAGMETMTFAAPTVDGSSVSFASVTRGAYRSRVGTHKAVWSESEPVVHETDAALLTQYPRNMKGRRVWLKWGLDAASDNDTITVFAGSIASLGWTDAGRTLVLECEDSQSWLRQPIFADLPSRLTATADSEGVARTVPAHKVFASGGGVYSLVEYIQRGGSGPVTAPSTFSVTFIAGTDDGRNGYKGGVGINLSAFPAVVIAAYDKVSVDAGAIPATNPLELALNILTSTGSGTNGDYDILPTAWGLAIPESDINVTEIEDYIAQGGPPDFRTLIVEPIEDAREWMIETLLKPFGFYLTAGLDTPIKIVRLQSPTPDEADAAASIGLSDVIVRDRQLLIEGPTQENTAVLGGMIVSSHPILSGGAVEFRDTFEVPVFNANDAAAWQSAPDVEIQAWVAGVADDAPSLALPGDALAFYQGMAANLLTRFRSPPSILKVTCSMELVGVEPGALVSVTLPNLPNPARATRGMVGELCEVWAKSIDLAQGTVTFELAQTNVGVERVRYLAPALSVTSGYTGTTLSVEQNAYTPGGGVNDVNAFVTGDVVRVYSADFASRSAATSITVDPENPTAITLASAVQIGGTTDPTAGCHIKHADYSEVSDEVKRKWAFKAGNDALLNATDAPHVYS